jgi:hypothetical protein
LHTCVIARDVFNVLVLKYFVAAIGSVHLTELSRGCGLSIPIIQFWQGVTALTLMEQVLRRLKDEYGKAGNAALHLAVKKTPRKK